VSRRLRQFFPASRAGLWLRRDRCVYLVFPRRGQTRQLWRALAGESVRGLRWAPDGKAFALTTGTRVVLLGRDGSLLRRVRATGAAFLRDGRLVCLPPGRHLPARSPVAAAGLAAGHREVAGFAPAGHLP
jgi:hypothetical protein